MKETANFGDSLRYGQLGEQLLTDIAAGYIRDGEDVVEVKTDWLVSKSSNVYVECESRGKPSGLATSAADYWAFILDGELYNREVIVILSRERLEEIIRSSGKRKVKGGDKNTSWGWNIPVTFLLKPLQD